MSLPLLADDSLRAIDLHYRRAGTSILRGVSLTVHAGERVALTGPSGSGKTTLLSLLAGLEPATSGRVLFGDRALTRDHPARARVAVVFQSYGLVSLLTAAENVEVALHAAGRPRADIAGGALAALALVGLESRAEALIEEMSGGQQQRVAVARALAVDPLLLLADEPTAELDKDARLLVLDALLATATTGTALVIATHDPDVADRCDRRVQLLDGRIQSEH